MSDLPNLAISVLKERYRSDSLTPRQLITSLIERADQFKDHNIFIRRLNLEELDPYLVALEESGLDDRPLYGIPFVIKDNIDLANIPTTAGCPTYQYVPTRSATVVERLIAAGAIPLGKANLDQFATGLVGTRSPEPWGPCHNAFDFATISGGSSSGSAVSVALGLASFSLGTDTAGSGRVPAALNNLIGVKPTRGLLSATGVVPACRSLDCVSIFALNCDDAATILDTATHFDPSDPFARPNPYPNNHRFYGQDLLGAQIGVIPEDDLQFFDHQGSEQAYKATLDRLRELGYQLRELDFRPFQEAAELLYGGPWVAERYAALRDFVDHKADALHPVTRGILEKAQSLTAAQAYESLYQLKALARHADSFLNACDLYLTPSIPRPYTIAEIEQQPLLHNTRLGTYTNFMNLLDYAALAVPAGFLSSGLPHGVTVFHKAFSDQKLLSWARQLLQKLDLPMAAGNHKATYPVLNAKAPSDLTELVVCGAHLEGQPLNWQLTERGAVKLKETQTAPRYRLFALAGSPEKPALMRDEEIGRAIEVEVWSIPTRELGSFLTAIPHPLGLGKVELTDGRWRTSFIAEAYALADCTEITAFGSWRRYLKERD